jgi:hypothetical protein
MNLQTIDNFTGKFGTMNAVINRIMDTILPQAIAAACHPNYHCYSEKGNYCHTYCWNCTEYAVWDEVKRYRPYDGGPCSETCIDPCDFFVAGGTCGGPC